MDNVKKIKPYLTTSREGENRLTDRTIELIDEFCKTNPMPERTYCKEAYKIENITLNFEHEYTKSLEGIEELEDSGVDTDKFITQQSKEKYALAEKEQAKLFFEHCSKCENPYCQWAYKRDSFVKERMN